MAENGTAGAVDTVSRDGRSARWDAHRQARRRAIIAAAVEAIERYGPSPRTAQIADAAGVARTHVYRHFDDRPALDLAVSRHVAGQVGRRIRAAIGAGVSRNGSAREVISASIGEHLGWIEAHPNLYRFLTRHAYALGAGGGGGVDDAKAVFAAELTALLEDYLTAFGVDPAPAQRVMIGVVGMVDATGAWWIDAGGIKRAQLTAVLSDQVWLILEHTARSLGLAIDPDAPLPIL